MDISNYNIEQCDAVSVLNAILDVYDKPTAKQVTLQQGISQILAAIPSAATIRSGLATEANATTNKQSILDKIGTPASGQESTLFGAIGNISVDTSDLAKQGTDEDATNSAIYAILKKIDEQNLIKYSYDGMVFETGHKPRSAFDVLNAGADYKQYLKEVYDEDDSNIPYLDFATYPLLEIFEMKNATNGSTNNWMLGSTKLRRVSMQSYSPSSSIQNFINGFSNLEYLNLSSWNVGQYINRESIVNCYKLIDIIIGSGFTRSNNILLYWNPSTARSTSSNSLVTDTQDEFGNPITNNKQQLLYNIRRHIAANLRTDVGNCTITFHANIKADILADAATLAAFPSNWTIA